jgi:hypothetical protein
VYALRPIYPGIGGDNAKAEVAFGRDLQGLLSGGKKNRNGVLSDMPGLRWSHG